jgi:hypothetical protein
MSQPTNRRRFLQATASSSAVALLGTSTGLSAQTADAKREIAQNSETGEGSKPLPKSEGSTPKYWIDPSIAAWPAGPMRKVHIEYHTSKHISRLADRFNADDFADQLARAHVAGATVFAKDMYGYSY